MTALIDRFFKAYSDWAILHTVYSTKYPKEMLTSEVDKDGWVAWHPISGTLQEAQYKEIEDRFHVKFPVSFINWHKAFFFLGCDCSIIRLPSSNPNEPLKEIIKNLDWYIPEKLIPQGLYPFASEGNDMGPLVFDARCSAEDNEYPIRAYDHEYMGSVNGLTDIIFSSFAKLIECLTHYLVEIKTRPNFEIIPDFFNIDSSGAGKTGIDYWLGWAGMQRGNYEDFGPHNL